MRNSFSLFLTGAAAVAALVIPSLARAEIAADAATQSQGDAAAGKKIFERKCLMCHTLGRPSMLGPSLTGVVGRKPGSLPGYAGYSPALRKVGSTWTPVRLDSFLIAPAKLVPGTRMPILRLQRRGRGGEWL